MTMASTTTRYSFTAQFLRGAAIFARRAHEIEGANVVFTDELQAEYVACVVGAVTQASAALEAEIAEVTIHGPGHHLGSNGLDAAGRDFLAPLVEVIDGEPALRRYELVLHLLGKPALSRGTQPYQNADLLVRLRNELVHFKSRWTEEMGGQRLFASLEQLKLAWPKSSSLDMNFFPHRCLSASLASWSVITSVAFINAFYANLGFGSPLTAHSERLRVPPASRTD